MNLIGPKAWIAYNPILLMAPGYQHRNYTNLGLANS